MQWFEGGIAEAVAASKQRNAVFVVFVEGKDEATKKTTDAINSPDVSAKLQGMSYVAIRIESDTTAHRQFAQIYQMVPVPSLFFIGNSGLPIEIVAGATDSQTLLGRLEVVEAVHAGRQAPSAASAAPAAAPAAAPSSATAASTTAFIAGEVASSAPKENIAPRPPTDIPSGPSIDGAVVVPPASGPFASAGSLETKACTSSQEESSGEAVPVEQRLERAKELLEKKRLEKKKEGEEEERRREMERRKMGKDVQEMKRLHLDQELKELQEQRRKEKEENALARQRVLDQIAQDKANRNAKASSASAQRPLTSPSEVVQRSTPITDGTTRLQVRLPDGSTHTSSFESTSSLGQVRSYLTANVELPFRSFLLATTFPRREFREEDNSLTLQDLGLVPTAVVLVIPSGGAGVVRNALPSWGGISGTINNAIWAIWTIISPVVTVITNLPNRMFDLIRTDRAPSTAGTARKEKRSKRASTGGTIRRTASSNIHNLHQNNSSSDDDNNTWNGNSTQQM